MDRFIRRRNTSGAAADVERLPESVLPDGCHTAIAGNPRRRFRENVVHGLLERADDELALIGGNPGLNDQAFVQVLREYRLTQLLHAQQLEEVRPGDVQVGVQFGDAFPESLAFGQVKSGEEKTS